MLHDRAVDDAEDVYLFPGDACARRGDAPIGSGMRVAERHARYHLVLLGNQILDDVPVVREGYPRQRDDPAYHIGAAVRVGRGGMIDEGRADEVVGQREAPAIEQVVEVSLDQGLALYTEL